MDIHINNFAGVEVASFYEAEIVLLGGLNGTGKSSILQAIAATIANQPLVRNADKKKNATAVVRRGAKKASVRILEDGKWEVSMAWPKCEYQTEGLAPTGHPLAVGLTEFTSLDLKQRASVLHELLQADPTIEDLAKYLRAHEIKSEKTVAAVWGRLDAEGGNWDAALKTIASKGAEFKAEWKAVTGESHGAAKGEDWEPKGWNPKLAQETNEALRAKMDAAQDTLNRAIGDQAVDQSRLEDLEARIADGPHAQEERDEAGPALRALEDELKSLEEERNKLHPPITVGLPCPHCNEQIVVVRPQKHEIRLEKADSKLTPDEVKQIRMDIASLDGKISNARDRITNDKTDIRRLDERISAAELAKDDLDLAKERVGTAEGVTTARRALDEAKLNCTNALSLETASKLHTRIKTNAICQQALSPTGVRATVLAAKLKVLNLELEKLSKWATHDPVKLDAGMDVYWGYRHFAELSDGEQRRVQIIIQTAFAMLTNTPIMTIDRFEVTNPGARAGLFKMIKRTGTCTFVAQMTADQNALPDLKTAKYGNRYWLAEHEEIQEL